MGTSLTPAAQELRTTGWLNQRRPNCKSMTLRCKRVSDLVAKLVEGGRKVGSDLLQFGNFPLQDANVLAQLASDARAQIGILQPLQNPGKLRPLVG